MFTTRTNATIATFLVLDVVLWGWLAAGGADDLFRNYDALAGMAGPIANGVATTVLTVIAAFQVRRYFRAGKPS